MSGWDGLLDGLRRRMRQEVTRVAGVAYHDGMLYAAGLSRAADTFEVSFLESVMLQTEDEARDVAVAEKTAAILGRKGWSEAPVVLALESHDVDWITASLPASSSPEEAEQMAHFEAARQLHREKDTFFSTFGAEEGEAQAIAILDASWADALRDMFEADGLELSGIAVPPESFCLLCEGNTLSWDGRSIRYADVLLESDGAFHGWDESFRFALYGAILFVQALPQHGCLFRLQTVALSSWAYGRAALLAAAVWFLALFAVSAMDVYGWYAARQAAEDRAASLALLHGDARQMEDDRAEAAWIETQEQALRKLTLERTPASSLLSHLGNQNVFGSRLEEITMQQGHPIELRGQAVTFDALSEYLQGFERDRAFFPDGPILLESTRPRQGEDDAIHFSIELRHAEEERTDENPGT